MACYTVVSTSSDELLCEESREEGFPNFPSRPPTGKRLWLGPETGPATPAEARERLQEAVTKFDEACLARAAAGENVVSQCFGALSIEDFARYQAVHTRRHAGHIRGFLLRTTPS